MRKIFVIAIGITMATFANADVLYWQVNDTDLETAGVSDYSYAKILYTADSGANKVALTSYLSDGVTSAGDSPTKSILDTTALYADLSGMTGGSSTTYQFVIELYGADNKAIANSGWQTWASLEQANAIIDSQVGFNSNWSSMQALGSSSASSWSKGAASVPEPTSGLLVLIGAALVGLRRKKVA